MADSEIVTNPVKFREAFLEQLKHSPVDDSYGEVLYVLLYYVWRGTSKSRTALIQGRVQADLGLLCLSTYKALLPVIQTIRLEYPTDAFILMRALMERIALLGYLHNNRDLIPKYTKGKADLQSKAMAWAKANSSQNWMSLYGRLSEIAHSQIEGLAGHILDNNPIGNAFRSGLSSTPQNSTNLVDELLASVCYALVALDPIAAEALGDENFEMFPADKESLKYFSNNELISFQKFLNRFIAKHRKPD